MGLGRRTFAPGEVLTASNVMNYLQDQAVMSFAGTAARGSAIGTAVSEGMVSYLQDTNEIEVYDGSAWKNVFPADASDIASGTLAIARGGTGATTGAGLVRVVPTSITLDSGSGSIDSVGVITFSGASSITINSCFSSSFRNYRIVVALTSASADADIQTQLTGPSTLSSGYVGGRYGNQSGGSTQTWYASQGSVTIARMSNVNGCSFVCDITNPNNSIGNKKWMSQTIDNDFALSTAFRNVSSAVSYTGMNLFTTGATFGGTISIYGYN